MKLPQYLVIGLMLAAPAQGRAEAPAPREPASPCQDEAFRAFDFWLGDWEVRTADGKLAGHNRIEAAHNGCVLVEHWTGASGGGGMSMNYLDKTKDAWVQLWTDAQGGQIFIEGGPTAEGMRLEGRIHYVPSGTTARFRGLWTPLPDGRVRQFFEQSDDDGKSWQPWFEGFYSRVESPNEEADADQSK